MFTFPVTMFAVSEISEEVIVTQGSLISYMGYSGGATSPFFVYGSVAPGTAFGHNIESAYYYGNGETFNLLLEDRFTPSDLFNRLITEDGHTLYSADANISEQLSPSPTLKKWEWTGVVKPAAWDGTGDVSIIFIK